MADVNVLAYDRSPARSREYAEAIQAALPHGVAGKAWCPAGDHPMVLSVVDTKAGRLVAIVERRRQELARWTRDEVRFDVLWIVSPLGRLTQPVHVSCPECGAAGSVTVESIRKAGNNRGRPSRLTVTPLD